MGLVPDVITYGLVALGFVGTLVAVVGLSLEEPMLSDFLGFIIPGVVTMLAIVRGWDLLRELVPHDD